MVRALRDPDGANLERVQIVKGWLDAEGARQEKIYDIAVSDGREIGPDDTVSDPVGSTVNGASFENTIGEAVLGAYWEDPDFDPAQPAVYYVRVLEIPTPTWIAHDTAVFGERDAPETALREHQERAYTLSIWVNPAS
ncbi:MAG: DUF3604 domain-containing protein [Mangrovicoccus sp.]|nr:DUF3604 domain-containing protein [Mangrovicoccus sp.]